jgi:hypothetical protein
MSNEHVAPMYVSRRVKNADDIIAWAESVGFKNILSPEDMHVTLAYSTTPVDWNKFNAFTLVINNTTNGRKLEHLGDAHVLVLESKLLQKEWQTFIDGGATWEYDDYIAHVSITYEVDETLDLSKIEPYSGVVVLGKQVIEDLELDD